MNSSGKLVVVIATIFTAIAALAFSMWQGTMNANTAAICLVVIGEGTYIEYLIEERRS